MLVLTRKHSKEGTAPQAKVIVETSDGPVTFTVLVGGGTQTRVGVDAPAVCKIRRGELPAIAESHLEKHVA